jgi:hypothetical protein
MRSRPRPRYRGSLGELICLSDHARIHPCWIQVPINDLELVDRKDQGERYAEGAAERKATIYSK